MSAKDTRALIRRIRDGIPGVALRTNFIVGFPGETEADFEELCAYVEEEAFDHVVVFPYEREPETPSHGMADQVPIARRRSRRSRLLALQQRVSRERLRRRVGEVAWVMVDGPAHAGRGSEGAWAARTTGQSYEVDGGVLLEGEDLAPGRIVRARVTGASAYDLFARLEATAALHVVGGPR
ncbi:MAG: hypothetical protein E6K80_13195 [Candidatus Eisenbacteria bacterium]|uniref:Uncharacterized protein n=1 Tax=Eiseniibacteriota bacterium TaxID=2212470 RepID=A0A538TZB0_UNCEI|nr:MAG: hypothetical protein E6K80_13195 [Candidatus Eisenbacteria bacterium]